MRLAFITYIRPLLEYNSIIWNPNYIYLIDLIENVQRKFTKALPSISSLPYSERLASLNLDLLELRRVRFDLVYYYKVFNHLTPFNPVKSSISTHHLLAPDQNCLTSSNQFMPQVDFCQASFIAVHTRGMPSQPLCVLHLLSQHLSILSCKLI
jgi:hypothetical protein